MADSTQSLRITRQAVQQPRANGDGIFDSEDSLRIKPFEVRYLGRSRTPNRFVIDLSRNEDRILQPQSYHRIFNPEDRSTIYPTRICTTLSRAGLADQKRVRTKANAK